MVDLPNRLWPAGVAAFTLHSLMIATLALGLSHPQGAKQSASKKDFYAEVVFMSEAETYVDAPLAQEKGELEYRQVKQDSRDQRQEKARKHSQRTVVKKASSAPAYMPPNTQRNLQQAFIGRGDTIPVFNPAPTYPREARRKKIQGVVMTRLSLNAWGSVDKVTILSPRTDQILEDAALRAVRHWRFPLGARTLDVPIEFKLTH